MERKIMVEIEEQEPKRPWGGWYSEDVNLTEGDLDQTIQGSFQLWDPIAN